MHKQWAVLAVTGVVLSACSDPITPSGPARLAPVAEVSGNLQSQLVPNEYIVALRTSQVSRTQLTAQAQSMAAAAGAQIVAIFGAAINGFAVKADAAAIANIRANPTVEFVEQVQVFRKIATQNNATWGLDRIDQRNLPLSTSFTYPTGGSAVNVYIIDTGINRTHVDYSARVAAANFDAFNPANNGQDCDGHGSHVSGTVAGTTYGIMKTATLFAVRVLDCTGSGTTTTVVNGINWVISNAIQPAVSNMSLGGGVSTALDNATNNMVAAGVVSAVAAGNSNADACGSSPARAANALTVGATTQTDARSSFSNFGTCLDIFAPGSSITSVYWPGNTATAVLSGTSMASPHVAGAAALYRSSNPTHTATQVANALITNATQNVVGNPGTGSPNRLLYMGFIGGAPPPTNQNPVANFTYTCWTSPYTGEFGCQMDGSSSSDPDGSVVSWQWTSPGKPNKTGVKVIWGFNVAGTYTVNLTVTDNSGGTNTKTMQITVGGPPPPPPTNQPPVANFTYVCWTSPYTGEFGCQMDGSSSSDPDGSVVSWQWTSPGKPNKTGVKVIWGFNVAGTYTVNLTVTDNLGAPNTKTMSIVVP